MNLNIPGGILVAGAFGIVGTLWNLWLTAERRAHERELGALSGSVEKLEIKLDKISDSYWSKSAQTEFDNKLNDRLDRIEDKLDRALAGGGQ